MVAYSCVCLFVNAVLTLHVRRFYCSAVGA